MPGLPEVETTLRGIQPYLQNQTIIDVVIRERRLRWPIPANLPKLLKQQRILSITRRAKYLIMQFANGHVLLHLGMSGSLRIVSTETKPRKHDHIDWFLDSGQALRLYDPRRFGSVHWHNGDIKQHPLLINLGPEPLSTDFSADYLFQLSRNRKLAVKNFIMNSHIVVGVGNIYASEALFNAGIHPLRAANRISMQRYTNLTNSIKKVLRAAIKQGGTTLRDFVNEQGNPGYFRQRLKVYERAGQACHRCGATIKKQVIGQRSTYYCGQCQR